MHNVMGVINNVKTDDFLNEITAHRSLAAVPFASRYRLLDFSLSSMTNSGIENVGILLHRKYRALLDHLGPGKEWNLDRKRDGLFFLPPAEVYEPSRFSRGDVENFLCNLDYFHRSSQEYALISEGNLIYNIDFRDLFNFHFEQEADITVLSTPSLYRAEEQEVRRGVGIRTDERNQIQAMGDYLEEEKFERQSVGCYFLRKSLLLRILEHCRVRGEHDLLKGGIIRNLDSLNVFAWPCRGYLAVIGSLADYYHSNMDLLNPELWEALFYGGGQIYTKVKDEAPSKFMKNSRTSNALIANGCVIEGTVENSILFRGVRIGPGAVVKNSIAMQKSTIGDGALIENTIVGKNAEISPRKQLKGEKDYPLIVKKRAKV